jgi:hypothetical protein
VPISPNLQRRGKSAPPHIAPTNVPISPNLQRRAEVRAEYSQTLMMPSPKHYQCLLREMKLVQKGLNTFKI